MAISSTPTAAEINVELGRAANAPFSINGAEERALAGVPSGPITFADFIGKSATILTAVMTAVDDAGSGTQGYQLAGVEIIGSGPNPFGSLTPSTFTDINGISRELGAVITRFTQTQLYLGFDGDLRGLDLSDIINNVEITGPGVSINTPSTGWTLQYRSVNNSTNWRLNNTGLAFQGGQNYDVILT